MNMQAKCANCGREFPWLEVIDGLCAGCRHTVQRKAQEALAARVKKMLMTTEASTALPITERLGIVGSQCALGMNVFKDMFVGGRDFWGGRSDTLQKQIEEGRVTALREMAQSAAALDADAVVAVAVSFSEFSGGGSRMLFIAATGTAVKLAG